MRLIEQLGAMLAAIVAKLRNGQVEEARQDLQTLCLENIGLSLDAVKQRSPEAIADHLASAGANRYPRAVLLAELLIHDAETLELQGDNQKALPSYLHAFCLLFDAFPFLTDLEQANYRVKLEGLAVKIEDLPPNPYTTERLRALREE